MPEEQPPAEAAENESGGFQLMWYRFVPFLGYHHILMIVGSLPTLFSSLVLAGCAATGTMQNLRIASFLSLASPPLPSELMMNGTIISSIFDFVLETSSINVTRVEEVQAGYFSICARLEPEGWQCGIKTPTAPSLAEASDPLGLVGIAHQFRTKTITPSLIILYMILNLFFFLILFSYPGWHSEEDSNGSIQEVKPFPRRSLSFSAFMISIASSLCLYIAIAWQHIAVATAASSVQGLRYGIVEVSNGRTSAVLSWLSVFVSLLCTLGMSITIVSTEVLSAMTD
ncbi:Ca2+ regulator and membrane fusion protein Fig1-domain-containing protein [Rostrohypoxylon terebratum]|nr:Ca2+ regulator and membrane fusion protein Fig1-domain-containing protein [Rostrohypoxylon terebratum]